MSKDKYKFKRYARVVIEKEVPENATDEEIEKIMDKYVRDFINDSTVSIDDIEVWGTPYETTKRLTNATIDEGLLESGDRIYVGGLGKATVVGEDEEDDEGEPIDSIEVFYVLEEDGTTSWQLLVDEHSDTVITSVRVIPDIPIEEQYDDM